MGQFFCPRCCFGTKEPSLRPIFSVRNVFCFLYLHYIPIFIVCQHNFLYFIRFIFVSCFISNIFKFYIAFKKELFYTKRNKMFEFENSGNKSRRQGGRFFCPTGDRGRFFCPKAKRQGDGSFVPKSTFRLKEPSPCLAWAKRTVPPLPRRPPASSPDLQTDMINSGGTV